ncbi:hypothetical protein CYY_001627 [Polysphondylium violaceum]|uniref:Glycosyltransferase n=1 Tax=Polysphondylium violaceum TaxID=133409 RepID=A0A8J4Q0R8_9MYCE|nr:hypothetical protein CYY_001627 [Polysphondylium violaceum]
MGKKPYQSSGLQFFTKLSPKQKILFLCVGIVLIFIFLQSRIDRRDVKKTSRAVLRNYHDSLPNSEYLTKNILVDADFNTSVNGTNAAWRTLHYCCRSQNTFSSTHKETFYILQSYDKWEGLFQPIDINTLSKHYKRDHIDNTKTKYHMFHFEVDYINYNHEGNMILMFRGLLEDNTTLDLDSRITVENKGTWIKKISAELSRKGAKYYLGQKTSRVIDADTQRISLTLYSEKQFQYIIPYVVIYEGGTIILRNSSMSYGETNELETGAMDETKEFVGDDGGHPSHHKSMLVPTYLTEPVRKIVPYFRKAKFIHLNNDISIVSQLDISRLDRLTEMSKNWDGFISVAIFIKEDSQVEELEALLELPEHESLKGNTNIHLVYKNPTDKTYPINYLRNVAIDHSPTDLVYTLDVDFITSKHSHSLMKKHILKSEYFTTRNNSLFCVAPFEIDGYDMEHTDLFPETKNELLEMIKQKVARPIHFVKAPEAHRAIQYKHWEVANRIYRNYYEIFWEPYCVFNKTTTLQYDPRFSGYGWDKVSHAYHLYLFDYQYFTVPDVFIAHLDHPLAPWIKRTNEENLQIWINQYESMVHLQYKHYHSKDTFKNFRFINIMNNDVPFPEVEKIK